MQGLPNLARLTRPRRRGQRAEADGGRPAEATVVTRDMDELLSTRAHLSRGFAGTHDTRTLYAVDAKGRGQSGGKARESLAGLAQWPSAAVTYDRRGRHRRENRNAARRARDRRAHRSLRRDRRGNFDRRFQKPAAHAQNPCPQSCASSRSIARRGSALSRQSGAVRADLHARSERRRAHGCGSRRGAGGGGGALGQR